VEHVQIGKVAAMKLLHGELSRDQAMVRRFNREARAVSRLTSPYTVSVFDYGRSAGLVYIVMELLSGVDLSKVLRDEHHLPAERVANIVRQVAISLTEAHSLGIIHRDLKPQNIFLLEKSEGEDRIKVLDFGLAKLAEVRDESMSVEETQAGVVMGTPHYMSPEQIRDRPIDQRADIYSLGAVAYRLLTGDPPFQHNTPLGVLHMHLNEPVPSLAAFDPRLAPLDRVIRRAMAKRPGDRYESVGDFASHLSSVASASSSSSRRPRIRILADPVAVSPGNIGTRQEFEVFERRLRVRRTASVFVAAVVSAASLALLVLLATGYGTRARSTESEPNDDLRTATTIRTDVIVTATAEPQSNSRTDSDVFRLVPHEAARVLSAVVTSESVDLVLEVVRSDGHVLVRANGGGRGATELIPNLPVPAEEVFLVVHATPPATGSAEYQVRARFRPAFANEESEPNETAPQDLPSSGRVVGMIGWPGDQDKYWLPDGAEGGEYRVELTGVPGVDLAIEISDQQATVVDLVDDTGVGSGELRTLRIDSGRYVGTPIVRVSGRELESSHLTYRLELERLGD
jgi:serine/threonine-protein kinase